MNYKNIYNSLIIKANDREISEYTEKHHIIPRCMGGDNSKSNLVKLTPEEHYLAHQLLVKIYPNDRKLIFAASAMTFDRQGKRYNNKMYGWIRRKLSIASSENNKGKESAFKGRIHTEESKAKMSKASKDLGLIPPSRNGIPLTEEQKLNLSSFWKGKKKPIRTKEHTEKIAMQLRGRTASDETKAKLSRLMSGKVFEIVKCPHCLKEGGSSAMGRWHFNNCKQKDINIKGVNNVCKK